MYKQKKRILLISPFPPLIGGVSISSQRLYNNLKEDGYDVNKYHLKPKNPQLNNSLGIIVRFFLIPFYILIHKKYDIIHCHVPGVYRKLYISLSRVFYKHAKLIFTIHGNVENILKSKAAIYALSKADKIICVQFGDSQKFPIKLRHKCVDIPAFIIPKVISKKSLPDKILKFIQKKDFPLISVNGLIVISEQYYDLYGLEDTINVYKKLKENNYQCKFLIIINNTPKSIEEKKFIAKLKEKIQSDDKILLIENEIFEFLPILKHTNIYLRPTKTDGDSLSIREALAMKCKVIASDAAIRPDGVTIYKNFNELFETIKSALNNKTINKVEVIDFYNEIKKQYE